MSDLNIQAAESSQRESSRNERACRHVHNEVSLNAGVYNRESILSTPSYASHHFPIYSSPRSYPTLKHVKLCNFQCRLREARRESLTHRRRISCPKARSLWVSKSSGLLPVSPSLPSALSMSFRPSVLRCELRLKY